MRVLLFGVDGLTFRILNPLMERGLLPNFQRVRDGGVQGILKSTTPPLTPRHGCRSPPDYCLPNMVSMTSGITNNQRRVRARAITHRKGGKAIWNILSDWGKQTVIANVPMTYPPEPINGIMLSGLMAPNMKANVTYPASFKDELLQAVPDYQIELDSTVSNGYFGDPLDGILKMTRERISMFSLLLNKPWDFCFIVFVGADRIQHLYWDKIMAFQPQVVKYYQMIDEALGRVLDALNAEDMLMIVSDHGFQGARRKFYTQEYLHWQGLLSISSSMNRRYAELIECARELVLTLRLQKFARRIRDLLSHAATVVVCAEQKIAHIPKLDWANSHAWIQSSSGAIAGYADIFLDDALTEENIHELTASLQEICDPETGQPLLAETQREDIFGVGPYAPHERHLILFSGENILLPNNLGRKYLWEKGDSSLGVHHPDGVLYLYGAKVKRGVTITPTHVCDVVPTILSCMGLPLHHDLDGKIMEEAFEKKPSIDVHAKDGSLVRQKLKGLATG